MSGELTVQHHRSLVPSPVGDLNAYLRAISKFPLLPPEEERELGLKLRDTGDVAAAHQLVTSHLRLVASTARTYRGYGLPDEDLIQEGNLGLMKAVKKFDPDRGARLGHWALPWIKNEIHEYVLRNWRIVKTCTTKAQRKLFWNLRGMTPDAGQSLTADAVEQISYALDVKQGDVREMELRLRGRDVSAEPAESNGEDDYSPIHWLQAEGAQPDEIIEQRAQDEMLYHHVPDAMVVLDDREKLIMKARWMGDEQQTLTEVGKALGISAERVRQLESRAFSKLREALENVEYS